MNPTNFAVKGFHISDDKDKLDRNAIHEYLSLESYWAKNIPRQTVETSIDHSICFGVYSDDGTQVGFARVISDCATFAYLCDVFILDAYRKLGLSKWLMETIHRHPKLQGLRRWSLATLDAHGLYEQFGWKALAAPERFLEINVPNIYQSTTNGVI